jgi:hypothetical protein
MTATLERRISRLEDNLPPPEEPAEDDLRWWDSAPEAVRAYFVAVEREGLDYYAFHREPAPDADELSTWAAARHPLIAAM